MTESATARRGSRATERRIADAAQRLADERGGLDGFTMDELAEAADVSRRTLFNYFPGKADAVLGPKLCVPEEAIALFRDGGPSGEVVRDLQDLVVTIMHTEEFDAETLHRFHRLIEANPVLLLGMKDRLHALVEVIVDAAVQRSGGTVTRHDARVATAVLGAAFDVAVNEFLERPEEDLAELFAHAIDSVRRLFA